MAEIARSGRPEIEPPADVPFLIDGRKITAENELEPEIQNSMTSEKLGKR